MKIIGLTGGIATGKSTVSSTLSLTCTVVDADLIARSVVAVGTRSLALIVQHFGKNILSHDGTLNRQALGSIIFGDKTKRKLLESITHPRIILQMAIDATLAFIRGERVCVMDIPLLFEGKLAQYMNEIWVVSCPLDKQIARLMLRDGISEAEALLKIDSQMPLEEKVALADYVIENATDVAALKQRVEWLAARRTPGLIINGVWWIVGVIPASFVYLTLCFASIYY